MGLREIAIGGVYVSPLLVYALIALVLAAAVRSVLYRLAGAHPPWFEAWFDVSLVVIGMAACAWLFSTPG